MHKTLIRMALALGAMALLANCGPDLAAGRSMPAPGQASTGNQAPANCSYCQTLGLDAGQVAANTDPNTGDVIICHYPPGNRANRHTLSVGQDAVPPHVRLHGDTIGPCGDTDAGTPPPDVDAGSPPPYDAGTPPPPGDAGTVADAGYCVGTTCT